MAVAPRGALTCPNPPLWPKKHAAPGVWEGAQGTLSKPLEFGVRTPLAMPSVLRSLAVLSFVCAFAVLSAPGCSQQGEGERCDHAKNGDADCDDGLVCVMESELVERITDRCCPADANAFNDSRCTRGTPNNTGGSSGSGGSSVGGAAAGAAGEAVGGAPSNAGSPATADGGMSGAGGTPVATDGGATDGGAAGASTAGQGGAG